MHAVTGAGTDSGPVAVTGRYWEVWKFGDFRPRTDGSQPAV
jgi:hypothetical protein